MWLFQGDKLLTRAVKQNHERHDRKKTKTKQKHTQKTPHNKTKQNKTPKSKQKQKQQQQTKEWKKERNQHRRTVLLERCQMTQVVILFTASDEQIHKHLY